MFFGDLYYNSIGGKKGGNIIIQILCIYSITYKNNKRSFRNDIVHGGISPKYEKVVDYGKTVHELIKNDYLFFKKNYAINMINANLDRRSRLAAPNGYPIGTCLITSYIEKECPIEDMIDDINDLNLFVNNIEQLPIVPLN